MLPNLIIIGAPKAGTTSLHYYLSLHPEISMSKQKELRFFSHQRNWQRGLAWYESQFSDHTKVVGEASPSYSQYPRFAETPERIFAVVPNAKLIYMVRDPVERLISHYTFAYSCGNENRTFLEALHDPENRYFYASRYYLQIERYLKYFPREKILVISREDLHLNSLLTLQTVFRFLDVDDSFWTSAFSIRLNEARFQGRKNRLGRWLAKINQRAIVHLIPMIWRIHIGRHIYRPFSIPVSKPALNDELFQEIANHLRDDIHKFKNWAGLDFPDWTL